MNKTLKILSAFIIPIIVIASWWYFTATDKVSPAILPHISKAFNVILINTSVAGRKTA